MNKIVFIILLIIIFGCNETSKNIEVKSTEIPKIDKCVYGNRDTIFGDFDGDGNSDMLIEHYYDSKTNKEVCKYIEGIEDVDRTILINPLFFYDF